MVHNFIGLVVKNVDFGVKHENMEYFKALKSTNWSKVKLVTG